MDKTKELIDKLSEAIENGSIAEFIKTTLIQRGSGKPMDHWSLRNQILCLMAGTNDARGFRQWEKVERHVVSGTRAIRILAPRIVKDEEENPVLAGFLAVPVFRIEDTEGKPVEQLQPKQLPPLSELVDRLNLKVEYKGYNNDGSAGAYFPTSNRIELCSFDINIFFHEICHAIHINALGMNSRSYGEKELVAELCGRVIADIYEPYHGHLEQAKAYCLRYSSDLKGSFMKLLGDIQAVLDFVFEIERKPETVN